MGQTPSISSLDPQMYKELQSQGLSQQDINELYHVFQQLQPDKQGLVRVETIQQLYKDSYDKPQIDAAFAGAQFVSFQDFVKVMVDNIQQKRKQFSGNIEFENGSGEQAGCFLCPYAVDKGPGQQKTTSIF